MKIFEKRLTSKAGKNRFEILGLMMDNCNLEEAVALIEKWAQQKRVNPSTPSRQVVTSNPEYVMAARRDSRLRMIINNSDLVTPDGIGLIIAGKILGRPFKGRVTGIALSHALARRSAQTGLSIFLLGAGPGVAGEAALRFKQLYPGINLAGVFEGKAGPEDDAVTLEILKAAKPDLILVAYGMVKQDLWIMRNLEQSGAAAAIGVGGLFDYVSGRVPIAPELVQRIGLEWAYRLYREPWRWRRQRALPRFMLAVLAELIYQWLKGLISRLLWLL